MCVRAATPASINHKTPTLRSVETHKQLCTGTTVLSHQCLHLLETACCCLSREIFTLKCRRILAEFIRKQNANSNETNITCVSGTQRHTHANTLRQVNSCLLALKACCRWVLTASVLYLCFIHSLVTLKKTAENKQTL